MPARVLLEPPQVALLLNLAGFDAADPSPLATIAAAVPCAIDGPGATELAERGLLIGDGPARRLNAAFRGVIEAAARPDEVLRLQVSGPRQPGFALCRRGDFWTECTVGPLGVAKLEYPLTRSAMVVAAAAALSTDHDDPPPLGFRFRGPAADLTVLRAVAEAGRASLPAGAVAGAVRTLLERSPGLTLAATLADPAGLRAILDDPSATANAVARLAEQGLVSIDAGAARASRATIAALSVPAVAGFVASRTIADPAPRTVAIQVWRAGDHNLVVRPTRLENDVIGIEARDIARPDLRALVTAVFQDESALDAALGAGGAT